MGVSLFAVPTTAVPKTAVPRTAEPTTAVLTTAPTTVPRTTVPMMEQGTNQTIKIRALLQVDANLSTKHRAIVDA